MKENDLNVLKISIVTVTLNSGSLLKNTIESVVNQTYNFIEYIIIDGNSDDDTKNIISKYNGKIAYWISEKDYGIYDAMNKGMRIATGDYIFFLNAGDVFYNKEVLETIVKKISKSKISKKCIILGNILATYLDNYLGIVKSKEEITPWYTPPHQGAFIPKKIYKKFFYYTGMKYLGDRELYLRLKKNSMYNVFCIDQIISKYNLNGVSSNLKNSFSIYLEALSLSLIFKNVSLYRTFLECLKMIFKYGISFVISQEKYYYFLYKYKNAFICLKSCEKDVKL